MCLVGQQLKAYFASLGFAECRGAEEQELAFFQIFVSALPARVAGLQWYNAMAFLTNMYRYPLLSRSGKQVCKVKGKI